MAEDRSGNELRCSYLSSGFEWRTDSRPDVDGGYFEAPSRTLPALFRTVGKLQKDRALSVGRVDIRGVEHTRQAHGPDGR